MLTLTTPPSPMGQSFEALAADHVAFLQAQKLFFVATATADSRVNISPKGMDSLRVLDERRLIWLNLTGSGNETAAHVQVNPRMTLMVCAFEGQPQILRIYGSARTIQRGEPDWERSSPTSSPWPAPVRSSIWPSKRCRPPAAWRYPVSPTRATARDLDAWARAPGQGRHRALLVPQEPPQHRRPAGPHPRPAPADDGPSLTPAAAAQSSGSRSSWAHSSQPSSRAPSSAGISSSRSAPCSEPMREEA